ncbi:MAG: mRNA interferase RelE/StbE [Candidatus Azotimanducaceae bacterium]|jgi:mRNA interferase RelE/StbE
MEKFRVTFKKSVAKDLRSIPNADVKRILEKIDSLRENPRAAGCIRLSTQERYRVRQGLYRIIYEIRDQLLVIHVVKIGHRSVTYKGN